MSDKFTLSDDEVGVLENELFTNHVTEESIRVFLVSLTKERARKLLDTSVENGTDRLSLVLCGTSTYQEMIVRSWIRRVVIPGIVDAMESIAEKEDKAADGGGGDESSESGQGGEASTTLHDTNDEEGGTQA